MYSPANYQRPINNSLQLNGNGAHKRSSGPIPQTIYSSRVLDLIAGFYSHWWWWWLSTGPVAATHVQIQDPTYICAFSLFNPPTQDPINSYYYYSPLEIDSDIQFLKFMRWNQAKVAVYAFSHSGSCLFTRGTSAFLSLSLCLVSCTYILNTHRTRPSPQQQELCKHTTTRFATSEDGSKERVEK